jgi:GDP-L-fucose synthase
MENDDQAKSILRPDDTILITGGSGLAGFHLREFLQSLGFCEILAPTSSECDLTDRRAVLDYFHDNKPDYVFHMAGFVRGIGGMMLSQAEAYLKNNLINTHVIDACYQVGVEKVVAMGSAAVYPELEPHKALTEEDVWKGPPHFTEYGYAHAKRGMLAQLHAYENSYGMRYAFAFSTNLYGPRDRFNTEIGHVVPSLIKKFHAAKQANEQVTVWGNGSAFRDFFYIKDCARALYLIMNHASGPLNLASGTSHRIREVVEILAAYTGMKDQIVWDKSKPNGIIYREYDVSRLRTIGFTCNYTLEQGLRETYDWYAAHCGSVRE